MNILILHTQVPFVSGGAEVLVTGLAQALRERGHIVDTVALPLAWNPPDRLLTSALAWRLLDLRRFNERVVERVICTKFPSWAVEHPRKSLWLVHQHRQAYDLHGTAMSEFTPAAASVAIRERVIDIDRIGIGECRPRYAISRNVAERLRRFNKLDAQPLYPPVPRAGLRAERYDPFILSASRLDASKRVRCAIAALARSSSGLSLVVTGDGPERASLESMARRLGVDGRVRFLGQVDDQSLRELFNTCRAVYYAPIDEDYGYTTVEALTAAKPVVTSPDSGGVLEFVADEETGLVTALAPDCLADAFDRLADEALARRMGERGPQHTAALTWETVVDALLER